MRPPVPERRTNSPAIAVWVGGESVFLAAREQTTLISERLSGQEARAFVISHIPGVGVGSSEYLNKSGVSFVPRSVKGSRCHILFFPSDGHYLELLHSNRW